jgi:hemerythrin-like domain-containing protein
MTLHRADLEPVRRFADHEHRELARGLEQIHDVACAISGSATIDLSAHVLQLLGWIDGTLEPHLQWEDAWLDPEIDARLGTPWATRAARYDHQQIRAMIERVRADRTTLRDAGGAGHDELRCHLFGLEAMLRGHIEREERFLLPRLDEPAARSQAAS